MQINLTKNSLKLQNKKQKNQTASKKLEPKMNENQIEA